MNIQIPFKCVHFTNNENMNKTCKGEQMCRIYYDEICKEYKEKEDERININNRNSNVISSNDGN